MDQNTATVIVGVVTALAAIIPGTLATIFAYRANTRSTANMETLLAQNVVLDKVSKQTDGLVTQSIDAEKRVSEAKEIIARQQGSDEARKEAELRALAVLAAIPVTPAEPTEPMQVNIVEAIPLEVEVKNGNVAAKKG